MSTVTQLTATPAELLAGGQSLPQPKPTEADPSKPPSTAKPADNDPRLVIQQILEPGAIVYAIVDRASGKVMARIAREEVAGLANHPDYSAGQVVNTKV